MSDQLNKYLALDNARHELMKENRMLNSQKDAIDKKMKRNAAAILVLGDAMESLEGYVCYNCHGRKEIRRDYADESQTEPCPICKGSGESERTVTAIEGNNNAH